MYDRHCAGHLILDLAHTRIARGLSQLALYQLYGPLPPRRYPHFDICHHPDSNLVPERQSPQPAPSVLHPTRRPPSSGRGTAAHYAEHADDQIGALPVVLPDRELITPLTPHPLRPLHTDPFFRTRYCSSRRSLLYRCRCS